MRFIHSDITSILSFNLNLEVLLFPALLIPMCKKVFSLPVYTRQLEAMEMAINTSVNLLMVNSMAKEATLIQMRINTKVNLLMANLQAKEISLVVMASNSLETWKTKYRLNLL